MNYTRQARKSVRIRFARSVRESPVFNFNSSSPCLQGNKDTKETGGGNFFFGSPVNLWCGRGSEEDYCYAWHVPEILDAP